MEYCSHGDARDLRHSPEFVFSFDTIIDWSIQLFDVLTYLHFHSIIHRDIKPSNIFVTKHFVMKLDWEMINSEEMKKICVHEKNDVYGMGLVIYELIQRERYCNDVENEETVHAGVKAQMDDAAKPFVVPNCDDEQLKSIVEKRYCNDEDEKKVHCARVKAQITNKPFVVPNCDDEQLKSIVEKCIHLLRSERYSAIEAWKALKALPLNSPYISVDTNVQKDLIAGSFKSCGITVAIDGSEDDQISCFKPNGAVPEAASKLLQARNDEMVAQLLDEIDLGEDEENKNYESDASIEINDINEN
ncbi:unnamed protein product, partial [Mesorhabditis belari]|uniref:Protein kinase domain-containing protein n=1 Tax=Mesorhabditis belari TaxID=2138241 RepID=A0AAF3J6B0_9BILA